MAEFKGFSEASIYYADNYRLVETLERRLNEEITDLFSELEDEIMSTSWYESSRMSIRRGKYYIDLLINNEDGSRICTASVYMSPRELSSNYSELGTHFGVTIRYSKECVNGQQAKASFIRQYSGDISESYKGSEINRSKSDHYLVRRKKEFDLDGVLEDMFVELKQLIEIVLPKAEDAASE